MEYYMFAHFGPNTFTDKEWGDGKEDPNVFNPTALDCRQWAATAKAAGMKGIILTAKHHDGFCLWPSRYSTHTVRQSRWRNGKGDVLKELSEACRAYGLAFGVYLSPWDRNHPTYGTPAYNQVFANMLSEVLGNYGPVFEQWLDGANGDAQKGQMRQVYDWNLIHTTIYKKQPSIIIFSDVGPDARWIGNERGFAGQTNWSRLDTAGYEPGLKAPTAYILNSGNVLGKVWMPAEADVSIRPGWFYSPETDTLVKSVKDLLAIYYASVGHNANLLLNVPPDREGRINPIDSLRLMQFRQALDSTFAHNLLNGARLKAGNTRGNDPAYDVRHLLDNNYDSYWATDNDIHETTIEMDLPKAETFNRFLVQEYIPLGQRVSSFSLEKWDAETSGWELIASGTTIGYKRILCFRNVTADKLRLNIRGSLACPILNEMGLYRAPE
ncbi:MAG: alpha-L-fucosidase [Tannerella sp.]|jgi:alpha-L-fucosidase|nr:alpha-L-fucosidase [Tannerella sp.]